jgi:hypothetical protein
MNIDLARYVVGAAFRSSRELGDLVPFLKEHLDAEEYRPYARAIASGVAAIHLDLVNKLFADHPGLEAEVEASIQKYGRYL